MSTYEISKSSLLSLKAEIIRKQHELSKAKVENETKIKILKKSPLEIKNKGVEARDKNDQSEVDQDLLKQSKSVLEYKAELYERLSSGKLSEEEKKKNKLFLVRFDQKNLEESVKELPLSDSESEKGVLENDIDNDYYQSDEDEDRDPGEKWIDYVDCFGRTRKCMQKDLDYLKSKDEGLKKAVEENNQQLNPGLQEQEDKIVSQNESNNKNNSEQSELMSSDMRRELLRQNWEKEEAEMLNKTDVHYQDVLFGEARTHGVGYYNFSKNEEERAKQQEALRKLRQETEDKQKKAQELKNTREKLLAARLKAARNRKRARMGLPPEEDEPEPEVPEPKISEEESKKQSEQEEKERLLEESRKNHIRPWDIGKEGVKEHQVLTQEEWVEQKREERPDEFAPPINYRNNFRTAEVLPGIEPVEENINLRFSSKKKSKPFVNKNKVNQMKKLDKIIKSSNVQEVDLNCDNLVPNNPECDFEDKLLQDYQKLKRRSTDNFLLKTTTVSSNEHCSLHFNDTLQDNKILTKSNKTFAADCDDVLLDDYSASNAASKRQGVEIAPPPTYDYYGPSDSKIRKKTTKIPDIQDSIEAGLKFLRKQVEEKEKSSKHPEDMFIF